MSSRPKSKLVPIGVGIAIAFGIVKDPERAGLRNYPYSRFPSAPRAGLHLHLVVAALYARISDNESIRDNKSEYQTWYPARMQAPRKVAAVQSCEPDPSIVSCEYPPVRENLLHPG